MASPHATRPPRGPVWLTLVLAALLSACGGAPTETSPAGPPARPRPDVLLVLVDDLRPDLGCYGDARALTPHLDRLAREGVVFERAYCQQALCSPSRTSLLTGLRPATTGVYDLSTHFRETLPDAPTLPQHFQGAGYRSIGVGKIYHVSADLQDPPSWSAVHEPIEDRVWAAPANVERVRELRREARLRGLSGPTARRASLGPPYERGPDEGARYFDELATEEALALLRARDEQEAPLFLAVGFFAPHLPFNAPARHWREEDLDAPLPTASPPVDAPQLAFQPGSELSDYDGVPADAALDEALIRELRAGYRACVRAVDEHIGRLLDELERSERGRRTIVVVTSDHGFRLGEYGTWAKNAAFEHDLRVPLIVRAPAAARAGARTRGLVELVDLFPSLCELAGLPAPDGLEGASFAPLLLDPERDWKRAVFAVQPREGERRGRRRTMLFGHSLRTDRYRYTRWSDPERPEAPLAQELYDHESDPGETRNLAGSPEQAELLGRLAAELNAGWRAALPAPN